MLHRGPDGRWRVDAEAAREQFGDRKEAFMVAAALALVRRGHIGQVVDSLLAEGPHYVSSLPHPDQLTILLAVLDRFASDCPEHANLIEVIRRLLPKQNRRKTDPRIPPAIKRDLQRDIRAGVGYAKLCQTYAGRCSPTTIKKELARIRASKQYDTNF